MQMYSEALCVTMERKVPGAGGGEVGRLSEMEIIGVLAVIMGVS